MFKKLERATRDFPTLLKYAYAIPSDRMISRLSARFIGFIIIAIVVKIDRTIVRGSAMFKPVYYRDKHSHRWRGCVIQRNGRKTRRRCSIALPRRRFPIVSDLSNVEKTRPRSLRSEHGRLVRRGEASDVPACTSHSL